MEAATQWSSSQMYRLAIEKSVLERYFPGRIVWIDPADPNKAKVEISLNTNDNTEYVLRIYITEDFPISCPVLVVASPKLKLRNGGRLPEKSTEFHTLSRIEEYPTVCHCHPDCWTPENSLYQVFMKGRVWLEAYSLYHKTGKAMDKYPKEFDFAGADLAEFLTDAFGEVPPMTDACAHDMNFFARCIGQQLN